jgi:DNA mismatch repair protein MutL
MSDALASQVAAGEVVERPASVVKELMENSLDAGAREVRVEVQRGGVPLLRVTDDGCGMNKEDALLSLERHATSKLRDKEGLNSILTLGFRGEAVPSIASVSRFRLTTRESDSSSGTEILIEGGTVREVREAGCSPGTVVEVRDLFFNIPARRKFLKSEATETAHVDHQVRVHALACPEVRFIFRKDGREIFDLAGTGDRRVRIGDLFGRELLGAMREVSETSAAGIAVSGYLLPAREARKSRRGQAVFLNGRPVEDAVIWRALAEGYRGSLETGRHPVAWLWLEMDPELVDVNVHPAKREVRFHRPSDLRKVIVEAVVQALTEQVRATVPVAERIVGEAPRPEREAAGVNVSAEPMVEAVVGKSPVAPAPAPQIWTVESQEELPVPVEEEARPAASPVFRVVGVIKTAYVLLEGSEGLVLMDPVAARERILYELFLRGAEGVVVERQGLLVPVLLELEARDAEVVMGNLDNFREAGLEVEPFGGNTIQLVSVPALLATRDAKALLVDLVDELVESEGGRRGRTLAFEVFAKKVAKLGGRGEPCREKAAYGLLDELFTCDLPYCAPDGRPTLVQMALSELDRKFGKC